MLAMLACTCLLTRTARAGAGGEPARYDRLAFELHGTLGTLLARAPDGGFAGGGMIVGGGLEVRVSPWDAVSGHLTVGFPVWGSVGVTYGRSLSGWGRDGAIVGLGLDFVGHTVFREGSDGRTEPRSSRGPQANLIGGYRWVYGGGERGLTVSGALHTAWLGDANGHPGGLLVGASGVRIAFDW